MCGCFCVCPLVSACLPTITIYTHTKSASGRCVRTVFFVFSDYRHRSKRFNCGGNASSSSSPSSFDTQSKMSMREAVWRYLIAGSADVVVVYCDDIDFIAIWVYVRIYDDADDDEHTRRTHTHTRQTDVWRNRATHFKHLLLGGVFVYVCAVDEVLCDGAVRCFRVGARWCNECNIFRFQCRVRAYH